MRSTMQWQWYKGTTSMLLLAFLVRVSSSVVSSTSTRQLQSVPPSSAFPKKLTLRTITVDVIPFIFRDNETDAFTGGFLFDLLEELREFASEDGVELTFDVDKGPGQYNPALDYVAHDCNTTEENHKCDKYDFVLGDYWPNPNRYERVEFTPRWLETGLCTMKYVHESKALPDVTTLAEASRTGATVCTISGSTLPDLLANQFPNVIQHLCPTNEACIEDLKAEKCSLFSQDYLTLLYRSLRDPTVEVTKELFQTQSIVFPVRRDLDPTVAYLLQRWLYRASYQSTYDKLFQKYFSIQLCPIGWAGSDCDQPCDPTHGTSGPTGECICESTRWTGDDCSVEVQEELNPLPLTLKVIGYCMFSINVGVVLVCMVWLGCSRTTAQVAVAQPLFLSLILVGCLISTSTIIALSQEGSNAACMAVPWLYSVGFCVSFGSLFAKIRRVRILVQNSAGMRRAKVSTAETLGVIGIILFIDVVILSLWTALDPLEWQRTVVSADKFGVSLESEAHCTSENWEMWAGTIAALHGCLLLFASYSCYTMRNVSTSFSEAKYLAIAMVSNLQIFVVGLPVLVIVGEDSDTSYFVRCAIIFINDLAVVLLIFGNLMYHTHLGQLRLRRQQSLAAITMREYYDGEQRSSLNSFTTKIKVLGSRLSGSTTLTNDNSENKANPVAQPVMVDSSLTSSSPACNPEEHCPPKESLQPAEEISDKYPKRIHSVKFLDPESGDITPVAYRDSAPKPEPRCDLEAGNATPPTHTNNTSKSQPPGGTPEAVDHALSSDIHGISYPEPPQSVLPMSPIAGADEEGPNGTDEETERAHGCGNEAVG